MKHVDQILSCAGCWIEICICRQAECAPEEASGDCQGHGHGPELLLLDETMAGLTATERKDAVNLIKKINTMGVAILTIEHNMDVVMNRIQTGGGSGIGQGNSGRSTG